MKRILLCMLPLFVTLSTLCQQRPPINWQQYDELLRKGSRQQTAGLIMTFTGGAGLGATFLTTLGEGQGRTTPGAVQSRHNGTRAAYLVSGAVALAGLAFCLASDKTKEHARQLRVAIKADQLPALPAYSVSTFAYPCLSVKLKL